MAEGALPLSMDLLAPREMSIDVARGLGFGGIDVEGMWTIEVVIVEGEVDWAAWRAALREISELPLGVPLQIPRMCILLMGRDVGLIVGWWYCR